MAYVGGRISLTTNGLSSCSIVSTVAFRLIHGGGSGGGGGGGSQSGISLDVGLDESGGSYSN